MPLNPIVGKPGGQRYDVARAIRTFLEQMSSGGGFSFGGGVIKELIQNSDDAGATELVVALDERKGAEVPLDCSEYAPILEPSLLIRNDAPFRILADVKEGDQDDFTAICDVAGGHKRLNPTAAGRFGIGFNSVYFLTDSPVLFSRREVHVFDLRHLMFAEDGWRFSLDDFPATASSAGPIKTALELAFPKAIIGDTSFQDLATLGRDYRQTIFRLPLRRTVDTGSLQQHGPVFEGASFPSEVDRNELLQQMCEEARRSMLFLKTLRRVVFGGIIEKKFEEWACVEAAMPTAMGLEKFAKDVREMVEGEARSRRIECSFRCDVSLRVNSERIRVTPGSAAFFVTHVADFTQPDLSAAAQKLRKNGERAVPWVALAAPLDASSFDWEGAGNARWRVFLPLIEEGPSTCILNAAVFVDPSRRSVEFRTDGSDETLRKSFWNRTLVEQLLVPLLRIASTTVMDNSPQLIEQEPKKYLSLFPSSRPPGRHSTCLADVVRASFTDDLWFLLLYDVWKDPFFIGVGPGSDKLNIEKVPEWLGRYKSAFRDLSTDERKFVAWNVGDAVGERLGPDGNVEVTKTGPDVPDRILLSNDVPRPKDLEALLKLLSDGPLGTRRLDGRWALQREGNGGPLLRFDSECLYLVRTEQTPPVYEALNAIGLSFRKAEWVASDVGLPALRVDFGRAVANIQNADEIGVLELLRRSGIECHHDLVSDHYKIAPVIDFLCSQRPISLKEDLRLAFLIKTAPGKLDRRGLGVVFIRPENPTPNEEDLWQGLLRQTFAEVDPQFAPHLWRLLNHASEVLTCLSDDGCTVRIAKGDFLDLLQDVREQCPDFAGRLAERLNQDLDSGEDRRLKVYRAARLLILEADRRWDSMDQPLKESVLALPIHRTASGELIALLSQVEDQLSQIQSRFFLQSADDLRDAPMQLPAGKLLHSLDPDVRRFYRSRLGVREQGRIEVLKECLRQIGTDTNRNSGILKYVGRHYSDAVEQLREGGGDRTDDLLELEELFRAARGVPCLDRTWHSAAECVDSSEISRLLGNQGFQGPRLGEMLMMLNYPRPVADTSSDSGRLSLGLWKIPKVDRDQLAELAISSESPDLPFSDRIRVIAENLNLVPDQPLKRAAVIGGQICETFGSPVELAKLVLVDLNKLGLCIGAVRVIVPEAADLQSMAAKFTKGRVPLLARALHALGTPSIDTAEVRSRTLISFEAIWSRLDTGARLDLLGWLGGESGTIPGVASSLDTVLVGGRDGEWVPPAAVIAPSWATPSLPSVAATSIARTVGIPERVIRIWDRLCGLNNLDAVVGFVVRNTCVLPLEQWPTAARRLARWLEEVAVPKGVDAVTTSLRNLRWVLAARDKELAFQLSKDVLDCAGTEVLRHEFWVVAEKIPRSLAGSVETRQLGSSREVFEAIARCLACCASAPAEAAQRVYELLVELTAEEQTKHLWQSIARSMPAYRLFRPGERGADRMVMGEELFLGNQEQKEDFGEVLFCFGSEGDRRRRVRDNYLKLGVALLPDVTQLVGALSRLPRESRNTDVHSKLVDALTGVPTSDLQNISDVSLLGVKVLSCARTYESLDHCYADPDLDRPNRLIERGREKLIDGRSPSNRKLLAWLETIFPGAVHRLRSEALAELTCEPQIAEVLATNVLDAWADWLDDLVKSGSVVHEEVEKEGLVVPSARIEIIVVAKIRVRFRLPNGFEVVPSEDWAGLEIFHDAVGRIMIRRDVVDQDFLGRADEVAKLDDKIADEVERLLSSPTTTEEISPQPFGKLRNAVRRTLERPGALLKRMKTEKQEHFLHQYFDQTADQEFSVLFDEYRRISNTAKELREIKKNEMLDLISTRFVAARRDQIRGYGYDEFAIFAELVQNAEDAYLAADQLGLPEPQSRSVTFTYLACDGRITLTATHFGRPFNVWRYGSKRIDAFRNDVEGVLKSAGSFKPHSVVEGERPIGRFGLGFKSVYLITDEPRIHSGDWHFKITAGCIPDEIKIPTNYEKGLTKIVLPLTHNAREERDGEKGHFANLLPFLRHIDMLHIQHSDGVKFDLQVTSNALLGTANGFTVDHVVIDGVRHVSGGAIRFLRARHCDHGGQLAVFLGSDGLPAAWSEGFDADVFAVLPLRAALGCGVGVSNLFEVQSGRTHLIDPAANAPRVVEITQSLRAVVKALISLDSSIPGPVMARFWSIWRWDRGDEETKSLRLQLAKELVELSRNAQIVPTLDPYRCAKLDGTVLCFFDGIPEELTNKLVDQAVEFPFHGTRLRLQKDNVISEPIRSALHRTYVAALEKAPIPVFRIGWTDLGEVFLAMPWLEPELLSAMARNLPPEKLGEVKRWLSQCRLRDDKDDYGLPSDLLPARFPGRNQLPMRLARQLHEAYDEEAVSLLRQVGLPSRPPLETLKLWVRSDLREDECRNLLHYLADAGRWRRDYYDLGPLLTKQWFGTNGARLTTEEAFHRGFLQFEEFHADPAFRAWLGVDTGAIEINLEAYRWDRPVADPKKALESIWAWWDKDSGALVREYELRTYPDGAPPQLNARFSERDHFECENWLSLFVLAALQTMGRVKPEQHRAFLETCKRRGWMEVFADSGSTAERWMGVLDDYLDTGTNESLFYHWVRQFVSIYQIARSLGEYVGVFLDIDKHNDRFDFDEILMPRTASTQSGGGWDAPPLTRVLGIGACFIVRELVRMGVLSSRHAHDHAYVGVGRVRNVFVRLGMPDLRGEVASYRHSLPVHRFLVDHLGPDRAHFNRCFDLPFLAIADDPQLQKRFLDCQLPLEEE
jgi:hypothetical protein